MTASAIPYAPTLQSPRRYTVAEYVQREIETDQKHIYKNGIIIPMAGGKPPHTRISGNAFRFISNELDIKPGFEAFNSEMKIHIPIFNTYNYADTCAVSKTPVFTDDDAEALKTPELIIEVLSGSTRGYDQKGKFEEYKTIPTFREYVLIEPNKPFAKSYYKDDDGVWLPPVETMGLDSDLWFESVGVSVKMSKIYLNVSFEMV